VVVDRGVLEQVEMRTLMCYLKVSFRPSRRRRDISLTLAVPTTPAFEQGTFLTTQQGPPIPAPSEEALDTHTALTNLTSGNEITEARALDDGNTQSQALDITTSDQATAQAYAPGNPITQTHALDIHTAFTTLTAGNEITEACTLDNRNTQSQALDITTSDHATAQTYALKNPVTPPQALDGATTENATAQAYAAENQITQAHALDDTTTENASAGAHTLDITTSDHATAQAYAAENQITQAHALDDTTTENASAGAHTPENIIFETTSAQAHASSNPITQAQGLNNAFYQEAITQSYPSRNSITLPHPLEEATTSENATAPDNSEDEFTDDEAEIVTDLDEEALKKLPPALRERMQAIQKENRERLGREGEPEEGPSDKGKGKGKAGEAEGLEGMNTSSDETSLWISAMDELADEARPTGVNRPNPLGSNPVTDEDREMIAEIYRRNEARREAARSRPVAAHRGNVGRPSDIVPMRQWEEEARRAGIPTSSGHREEDGTPVHPTALPTLRRPLEAITRRAAAAVRFVKAKLRGAAKGKGKGKGKGPEGPEEGPERRGDLVVGSSYKTRPSGRRNPAASDQGPPPGLNMTTRGHVEDYTI